MIVYTCVCVCVGVGGCVCDEPLLNCWLCCFLTFPQRGLYNSLSQAEPPAALTHDTLSLKHEPPPFTLNYNPPPPPTHTLLQVGTLSNMSVCVCVCQVQV